jgi:ATP-binding cassette subfamily B (MDR/TAP) protein 1
LQATGQRVGIVLQSIATMGLGIGLAIYFVWRLGLVIMCFIPVILLAQYFFLRIARGETLNNQKALEKSTKVSKVSGSVKLTCTISVVFEN